MGKAGRRHEFRDAMNKLLSIVRIGVGFMILEHGYQTAFGLFGGRADWDFARLHAWAGPIEAIGATLLVLGLFTRPTAFILSGEMAVAYFQSPARWATATSVFFPIANNGEEAALNCFIFLWLATTGGGSWSLDALIAKRGGTPRAAPPRGAAWEPQARALMRMVAGHLILLHGLRVVFGFLPERGRGPGMALDHLGQMTGYLFLAIGVLMFAGLFTKITALVLSLTSWLAYFYLCAPLGPLPVRNGGNDVLLYAFTFMFVAAVGAGAWSLDRWRQKHGKF